MQTFSEILKLLLPSGVLLYGMYLMVKLFLNKQFADTLSQTESKKTKDILKLKLQAYERIMLFLERISPAQLTIMMRNTELNAEEWKHVVINQIREEYNHNITQQLYISSETWNLVVAAKEHLISNIHTSSRQIGGEQASHILATKLIEVYAEDNPLQEAIQSLKNEVHQLLKV